MKRNILSEVLLYKYRYIIGYLLFAIVLIGALYICFYIPGQLSVSEQNSAVSSATISLTNPSTKNIVDLPFHLLQKASMHFFHITDFGIKLPALIIAALSALGLLWLLRRWLLRDSIAIFTICIFISSRLFMGSAQEGAPLIMMSFWMIFILLFALKFTANNKSFIWGSLLTASLALSLYTPLTIYVLVCLLAASILHPHLRYVVSTIPKLHVAIYMVIAGIILTPLAVTLIKDPLILATFAGWPDSGFGIEALRHNIKEIIKAYLFFWQPSLTAIGLIPLISASSFVLVLLGILNLVRDHHSARSYMLVMTLPILILPSFFNPSFLIILGIPTILLLGLGIETLLDEWYKLFPHNPYARVTALVPMSILLAGIMIGNLTYYINAYRYSPNLSNYYTYDLKLARETLKTNSTALLVTNSNDRSFYALLNRDFPNVHVTSNAKEIINAKTVISHITPVATPDQHLKLITTDSYKDGGVRFYVYEK